MFLPSSMGKVASTTVFVFVFLLIGTISSADEIDKGKPITFQTEVKKMLDILIHSLYQNRDIFLRELISNGSDALDKIRTAYLTSPQNPLNSTGAAPTMDIRVSVDKGNRQITIRDGGLGMTHDDMKEQLGTLGASGTKRFMETIQNANSNNLIGQFGVGFYSIFLVSDRVVVASKHDNSEKQWIWESTADGSFFIYEDPRGNTLGRGTEITMHLKEDADEFLDTEHLRSITHKYSEFINYPIFMNVSSKDSKNFLAPDVNEKDGIDPDMQKYGDPKDEETEKGNNSQEEVYMWQRINTNRPIWTRDPKEIEQQEYHDFYKSLTQHFMDPLWYNHFTAEGEVEFKSILFIDGMPPTAFDLGQNGNSNIHLYVRRVFITNEFDDLLPRYLNFVHGIVDSDDLPLNVSREVLQENRILKVIRKKLVRKILAMLQEFAAADALISEKAPDPEQQNSTGNVETRPGTKVLDAAGSYARFWENYGKNIRLGIMEDYSNRNTLMKLLRYKSSFDTKSYTDLESYVKRMPKNQNEIFYLSGESLEALKQHPVLEEAEARGVEVLLMTEAIDEYMLSQEMDFERKPLVDLSKKPIRLTDDDEESTKSLSAKRMKYYSGFLSWMHQILAPSGVFTVAISERRISAPILVRTPERDLNARLAKILKHQPVNSGSTDKQPTLKKVVEINHLNPLVDDIFKRFEVDPKDPVAKDMILLLFDVGCVQNGFEVDDTQEFGRRLDRMMRQSSDIALDAPLVTEDTAIYDVVPLESNDEL